MKFSLSLVHILPMNFSTFDAILNSVFPSETAWKEDKIGIHIDIYPQDTSIVKVLIAYEINDEVVEEAKHHNVQLICAFHPLIFNPLSTIISNDRIGKLVHTLIQSHIGVYIVHTNFDAHPKGTNVLAAEALGLSSNSLKMLVPDKKHDLFGMGIIGNIEKSMPIIEFVQHCSRIFSSPISYTIGKTETISRIAIVCGSGMMYFNEALSSGADCFITADIKYHQFHEAKGKITLIDPGHAQMEQFVARGLLNILNSIPDLSDIEFIVSEVHTSPVSYIKHQD